MHKKEVATFSNGVPAVMEVPGDAAAWLQGHVRDDVQYTHTTRFKKTDRPHTIVRLKHHQDLRKLPLHDTRWSREAAVAAVDAYPELDEILMTQLDVKRSLATQAMDSIMDFISALNPEQAAAVMKQLQGPASPPPPTADVVVVK